MKTASRKDSHRLQASRPAQHSAAFFHDSMDTFGHLQETSQRGTNSVEATRTCPELPSLLVAAHVLREQPEINMSVLQASQWTHLFTPGGAKTTRTTSNHGHPDRYDAVPAVDAEQDMLQVPNPLHTRNSLRHPDNLHHIPTSFPGDVFLVADASSSVDAFPFVYAPPTGDHCRPVVDVPYMLDFGSKSISFSPS